MPPQRLGQAPLSKFFSRRVEGFRDAVGVEGEGVPGEELAFLDRTIPFFEESQNRTRGLEPFHNVVPTQQKS